jgi:paraquat-inducible protein B
MNENGPDEDELPGVAAAVVEARSRPSIVWLIPLVAVLAGGFVAWRVFSERGPEITISFKSAEGIEAGKTKIKYKDVDVGLVEEVELAPDLSRVLCRARMVKGVNPYLKDKTRFWIVSPRIAGGQVSGLSTLLSGAYIGVDPVTEGKHTHEFTGLDEPPVILATEPGRYFVLRSDRAGTLDVAAPVFFRKIQVGRVVSSRLDPKDESVTTRIFVQSPYDARVRSDSRFWNASGIDVSVGAQGVRIDTESVVSILIGGIAFDTPPDSAAPAAPAEAVFPLYENHEEALKRRYAQRVAWLLHFDQSVRGLDVGAPVEFRGMPLGEVTDVRLEYDPKLQRFVIPVRVEIEAERIEGMNLAGEQRREGLDRLVAQGLRAQLATGNLVTGQLIVSLDFHEDAPPAQIVWGDVPEFPTIPTPFEEITESLTRIAQGLGRVPFEQIGKDLQGSLAALRVTLNQSEGVAPALKASLEKLETTLASTNTLIGPDSNVNGEVQRALYELSEAARALALAADQIQTQPSSVIFGKKGSR